MLGYILLVFVNVGKNWDFTFLVSFGVWGMVLVQTVLQMYLSARNDRTVDHRRKRHRAFKQSITASTLNPSHYTLDVILSDKTLAKAFEDHLQREFGLESLFFYQEAQSWKLSYQDVSPMTRAARARKIIRNFIDPDGIFCVNISSHMTRAILDSAEQAAPDQQHDFPRYELFDQAIEEIKELLELGALARFKNTQTFRRLIHLGLQHLAPLEV